MKFDRLGEMRNLSRKLDKLDREIDLIQGLSNDDYSVSWHDRYGIRHDIDISAKLMLPVIKQHRENLIEEKSKLEKKLEEL